MADDTSTGGACVRALDVRRAATSAVVKWGGFASLADVPTWKQRRATLTRACAAISVVSTIALMACGGDKPRCTDATSSGGADLQRQAEKREITASAHCGFGRTDSGTRTLQLRAIVPIDWVLVAKADLRASEGFRPHTRQFWDVECTGDVCEGVLVDLTHVDADGELLPLDVSRPSMRIANGEGSRVVIAWGPYRTLTYDEATRKLSFAYSASDEEGRGAVDCR